MAANLTLAQRELFQDEHPDFLCPITLELMHDPVIAADGHTYERADIREWLAKNNTSPFTSETLENKLLIPNHMARKAIDSALENFKKKLASETTVKSPNPTPSSSETVSLPPGPSSSLMPYSSSSFSPTAPSPSSSPSSSSYSSSPSPVASSYSVNGNPSPSIQPQGSTSVVARLRSLASRFFSAPAPAANPPVQPLAKPRDKECDFLFKISLIGDVGSGKSCLFLRFVHDIFTDKDISTIGMDSGVRTIDRDDHRVKLQIWDTAAQEQFRITKNRGIGSAVAAYIIAFDVSNRQSFTNVNQSLKGIMHSSEEGVSITLVATKCDTPKANWQITEEEIKVFAEGIKMNVFFTSAKEGLNVTELFSNVADSLLQKQKEGSHLRNSMR